MKKYIYLNDRIVSLDKAAIFANDLGLLRGFGVMDFLRTFNGKLFHLPDHYKRFCSSVKMLGLRVPVKEEELAKILGHLLAKNKVRDASFRLILTPGRTDNGLDHNGLQTFFILTEDPYNLPDKMFIAGASLITSEYERILPESKHLNYLWAVKMYPVRKKKEAVDLLYLKDGKVTECATSNIFIVKKDRLITPKKGILPGITRKVVLDLSKKLLQVKESEVTERELWLADEVFITATSKSVLPITKIDGKKIGGGQPGPWTKKVMTVFDEYKKNY